ncbi:hypothetical protein Tco_0020044 [Tanacetum coccineum]
MIYEPGDPHGEPSVAESTHEQTDVELTKKEAKQMKVDDQAIQTIRMGLPEDIYAALDICDTTQEIWLRVEQMMKGSNIGAQEKKAKLFNEWEKFNSTDGESIESYYHRIQNVRNQNGLIIVPRIDNHNRNGNVVAAQAEGDIEEIEEVNENCILMANLQRASTSDSD